MTNPADHLHNELDSSGPACEECGALLPIDGENVGACVNVGTCYRADRASVPPAGDRMKSPRAFTISGAVD